jgi:hypothetical protein
VLNREGGVKYMEEVAAYIKMFKSILEGLREVTDPRSG